MNVGEGLVTPLTNPPCEIEYAMLWEVSGRNIFAHGNTYVTARTVGFAMEVRSQRGLGLNGIGVL
jgi:hypothetical protein